MSLVDATGFRGSVHGCGGEAPPRQPPGRRRYKNRIRWYEAEFLNGRYPGREIVFSASDTAIRSKVFLSKRCRDTKQSSGHDRADDDVEPLAVCKVVVQPLKSVRGDSFVPPGLGTFFRHLPSAEALGYCRPPPGTLWPFQWVVPQANENTVIAYVFNVKRRMRRWL